MRLLASEYKDLNQLVLKVGKSLDTFELIKQHGVVSIKDGSKPTFSFYRRKKSQLNELKQFEDHITYHLGNPKNYPKEYQWNEILELFEAWCAKN